MKHHIIPAVACGLLLAGCSDPEENTVWEDGSTLWLSGVYADTALSWSPHGDILFFSTWADGSTRLFGTDGLSSPAERTFTSLDEYMGPLGAWNAENGRIVYTAMNTDSLRGQIRSIAGNDTFVTIHVNDGNLNAFPTYNVAGDSILYCGMESGSWRFYKIPYNYSPDSEGSPVLQAGFPQGDMLRPSYSPVSGSRILFQHRESPSDDWNVMIANPDGSGQKTLAGSSADDIHPTWGPDDSWVAFSSNRTGNFEIYLTHIETDTLIQLTDHPAADIYPAWNPGKSWIAFSSNRVTEEWNYDIMAIDEPQLP